MSTTRTRFMTQARTWIIISGLAALFVSLGYVFGGSAGLILFAGIAIVFNLVMFWKSDKLALKASKARPVSQSEAAGALSRHRGDRRQGRCADAARLPHPVRAAERVRDRPEPEEGRHRRDRRASPLPAARAGQGRPRARDGACRQPRHPRDDDRRDDRRRDRGDREHPAVLDVLRRRRRRRQPAGDRRRARRGHRRPDRSHDPAARRLAPARVPRGRDRGAVSRRGPAAGRGARDARARSRGRADERQPGDRVALHREPAQPEGHVCALLDTPADGKSGSSV